MQQSFDVKWIYFNLIKIRKSIPFLAFDMSSMIVVNLAADRSSNFHCMFICISLENKAKTIKKKRPKKKPSDLLNRTKSTETNAKLK